MEDFQLAAAAAGGLLMEAHFFHLVLELYCCRQATPDRGRWPGRAGSLSTLAESTAPEGAHGHIHARRQDT